MWILQPAIGISKEILMWILQPAIGVSKNYKHANKKVATRTVHNNQTEPYFIYTNHLMKLLRLQT